jgi:hypothetical protein
MPKLKFNNFDICAEVACLRKRCVGMWLTNVYDLDDKKQFLFKFSRSGGGVATHSRGVSLDWLHAARHHLSSIIRHTRPYALLGLSLPLPGGVRLAYRTGCHNWCSFDCKINVPTLTCQLLTQP